MRYVQTIIYITFTLHVTFSVMFNKLIQCLENHLGVLRPNSQVDSFITHLKNITKMKVISNCTQMIFETTMALIVWEAISLIMSYAIKNR